MRTVFVDTFYLFALANRNDLAHAKAVAFAQSYRGSLVTTEFVLLEWLDGCSAPAQHRATAVQTVRSLRVNPDVTIVPCSEQLFQASFELYERRPDKEWSLTDCASFVIMQQRGICEALTADHHFEQAGLVALLQ